jgi:hypothetical protein
LSADRTSRSRRSAHGAGAALALLALFGGTSACASEADAGAAATGPATSATSADDTTRRIAAVEFARQCTIAGQSFADEAGITTDLDVRLAAAGFTHQQWKQWHDALVDSPELVEQFAELSSEGCPEG